MPIPGLSFTDEQLWDGINAALPAWALLLLAPRWRYTMPLVTLTAVAFSALYAATLWGSTQDPSMEGVSAADMFSLDGVARLLAIRAAVLPAWLHYVVFDLWTARWEVADALERGVPQLAMALPIFLTCMAGPSGLLLYLAAVRPLLGHSDAERRAAKVD